MKKLLTLCMALLLVVSMAACSGDAPTTDPEQTPPANNLQVEFPGGKISGPFANGMPFSEGRAFVRTKDSDKVYCITKEGDIVFALTGEVGAKAGQGHLYDYPDEDNYTLKVMPFQYVNGLAPIASPSGAVIAFADMEGKLTKASDFGVDQFGCQALRGGYILAYVKVADNEYKLGIMNTKFEWTVEASAELYASVGFWVSDNYVDGFLYVNDDLWLDLATGEVASKTDITLPSHYWYNYGTFDYTGLNGEKVLDLHDVENIAKSGLFRNGKAPVVVCKYGSTNEYSLSFVSEYGRLSGISQKLSIKRGIQSVCFDGNHALVVDSQGTSYGGGRKALCYDADGQYCGTVTMPSDIKALSWVVNDGVISARCTVAETQKEWEMRYFDVNGTQLFVG